MQYKGMIHAIICLLMAGMVFMMTGCQSDGLRKQAYTEEELEVYLEDKYEEEFTVLSRTEVYDSYTQALQQVEYEIQCDSDSSIVFSALDKQDGGMAGWSVSDDFQNASENEK